MNVEEFIDAICFFGEPDIKQGVDKSTILAPYVQELAKYEGPVLAEALKLMMVRRTYRNFPLLSECLQLCMEAEKASKPDRIVLEPLTWNSNRKTAQQLVMEDRTLAKQAAKEGWIHALWDFCRVNQRRPQGPEIELCRDDGFAHKRARLKTPNPDAEGREERLVRLALSA